MSRRWILLTMLAVIVAVGIALASTLGGAAPRAPVTEAGNRRAAASDDRLLLGQLVLPAGAVPSPREPPGSGLDERASHSTDPNFVDEHAWWVVPRPEVAAVAFVKAHAPLGSHVFTSGWGSTRGIRTSSFVWFQWPAVESVLYNRVLTVSFVALSRDSTAVRADAQDVWDVPRPASERIPSSARVLEVGLVSRRHGQRRDASLLVTVTDAVNVSKIAAAIDRLALRQPFSSTCRAEEGEGPLAILDFRARLHGPVLAQASEEASGGGPCEPMHLWIDRHAQSALDGGYSVVQEAERLLRITLSPAPPRG
jgi:hypothetical protein